MPELAAGTGTIDLHPAAARTEIVATPVGVGAALPARVVTNAEVAERLGVSERWITARTGIDTRRRAEPAATLVSLATEAGAAALAEAGVPAHEVDLVLVATMTADDVIHNAAPQVAAALGAPAAAAFDVGAACSGFVLGLEAARGWVESGRAEHALVIGADLMSRVVDPEDRNTAALFGDGAGAILLTARLGLADPLSVVAGADGDPGRLVVTPHGGTMRMQGHDTFRLAVDRLSEATRDAVALAGLALADVDLFVFHQANGRILSAVGERLELPPERVVNAIAELGNTSAATVPLALAAARDDGRLRPGTRVLLGAFGAGMTWVATLIRWGERDAP
jgi:3-oxoacyl-[acyl-carrier-protein] synthase-3